MREDMDTGKDRKIVNKIVDTDIRKTRTCQKCQTQIPLDQVRLYPHTPDKNLLVCEECCNKLKNAETMKRGDNIKHTNKEPIRNIYQHKVLSVKRTVDDDVKDIKQCMRCKYNFKISNPNNYDRIFCPYCGKDDKVL